MGYRKKGSTASLKASGAVATVLLIAGILTGGRFNRAGLILALGECNIVGFAAACQKLAAYLMVPVTLQLQTWH